MDSILIGIHVTSYLKNVPAFGIQWARTQTKFGLCPKIVWHNTFMSYFFLYIYLHLVFMCRILCYFYWNIGFSNIYANPQTKYIKILNYISNLITYLAITYLPCPAYLSTRTHLPNVPTYPPSNNYLTYRHTILRLNRIQFLLYYRIILYYIYRIQFLLYYRIILYFIYRI